MQFDQVSACSEIILLPYNIDTAIAFILGRDENIQILYAPHTEGTQ